MSFECKHHFMQWCIRQDGKPPELERVWIDAWNAAVKACEWKAIERLGEWERGFVRYPSKGVAAKDIASDIGKLEHKK